MSFFSVILVTYNSSRYIEESISSVLNQTYKNFELIIIDDGSTDKTINIIKKFKDNRIKYKYQTNQGPSKARNFGIKISKSRWICFIDADDYWNKNKLKVVNKFLSGNKLRSGIFEVELYKRLVRPLTLIAMILVAMLFIFGSIIFKKIINN